MDFTLNTEKRESQIQTLTDSILKLIKYNLSNGLRITEIEIPKEFAGDVKDKIDEVIKGKDFEWMIVRRGNNPYTGKVQHFISETIGEVKYYKLKYHGD